MLGDMGFMHYNWDLMKAQYKAEKAIKMIGFHSLEHLNLVKFGQGNWDYIPSLFTNLL